MLDLNSFDEKDFKNTLNQYKEFCIKELKQMPDQDHAKNPDLSSDRSFIRMQNLFQKPKLSIQNTPKQKPIDLNPKQPAFKTQHFMAVPIKTAKFNVDNRTLKNKFTTIEQQQLNNKYLSPDNGVGISPSSQSQMDINTPKRKALLLKANFMQLNEHGHVITINGNMVHSSSQKNHPGHHTNQYQQPYYLKTKHETFQKLITNNQIKRCQLEQIMFNDRVAFQNNPLVVNTQQDPNFIGNKKTKTSRVFSKLERRRQASQQSETP